MTKTPRPETEWIYDDLGRMKFAASYDFTSSPLKTDAGDDFIGIVFAYTDGPSERQDGEKRFQLSLPPSLARALVTALQTNLSRLPR